MSCENVNEWSFRHIEPMMQIDTSGQLDTGLQLRNEIQAVGKDWSVGQCFLQSTFQCSDCINLGAWANIL